MLDIANDLLNIVNINDFCGFVSISFRLIKFGNKTIHDKAYFYNSIGYLIPS